jgi:hypothetical protein
MKKFLAALLLVSFNLMAQDYSPIPRRNFQIRTTGVEEKLQRAFTYPEGILKRFQPQGAGATISNKRVSRNTIQFEATKRIAFLSKTVFVQAQLDAEQDNRGCGPQEKGYSLRMSFDGSDSVVNDNVDRLESKICTKLGPNSTLSGYVQGKIFKGYSPSMLLEGLAAEMIVAQVDALLKAIVDEVQLMR